MMNSASKEKEIRERVREKIDRGIEQLAQGERLDGEPVFAELEAELDKMERIVLR